MKDGTKPSPKNGKTCFFLCGSRPTLPPPSLLLHLLLALSSSSVLLLRWISSLLVVVRTTSDLSLRVYRLWWSMGYFSLFCFPRGNNKETLIFWFCHCSLWIALITILLTIMMVNSSESFIYSLLGNNSHYRCHFLLGGMMRNVIDSIIVMLHITCFVLVQISFTDVLVRVCQKRERKESKKTNPFMEETHSCR